MKYLLKSQAVNNFKRSKNQILAPINEDQVSDAFQGEKDSETLTKSKILVEHTIVKNRWKLDSSDKLRKQIVSLQIRKLDVDNQLSFPKHGRVRASVNLNKK